MLKKEIKINAIDITTLLVVSISSVSILMLCGGLFNAYIAVCLGTIFVFSYLFFNRTYLRIKINYKLVILCVFALLFRAEPFLYISGGQDQGVYVNMSKHYQTHGSPFVYDNFRERIKDRYPELLQAYDTTHRNIRNGNYSINNRNYKTLLENRYEGNRLPGLYISDLETSRYVFQFYPMHPIWMAIFGDLFGDKYRAYSLVFFSILSLIFFYKITLLVTGNQWIASLGFLLLAVNPLHVFFSKFPVTEIIALSFTLGAFYYLIRYNEQVKNCKLNLWLSAGLMGCFFFTRISGFMYLPFLMLLYIVNSVENKNPSKRKSISHCLALTGFLYLLSLVYGLTFSFPYSWDIYNKRFSSFFGHYWLYIIPFSIALLTIITKSSDIDRVKTFTHTYKILPKIYKSIPFIFICVLIFGLLYVRGNFFHELGWSTLFQSSLFLSIFYISLPLFLFLCFASFGMDINFYAKIIFCFVLIFWVHSAFLQPVIPYQYYYSRYLLSEIVPYSLLFALLLFPRHQSKKLVICTLAAIALSTSLYFTVQQFKGQEDSGSYIALNKITDYIDARDVLIIDTGLSHSGFFVQTPIVHFFQKRNILRLKVGSENYKRFVLALNDTQYDVYILTPRRQRIDFNFEYTLIDNINYAQGFFERTNFTPNDFILTDQNYSLFRIDKFGAFLGSAGALDFHGMHDEKWTTGKAEARNLNLNCEDYSFIEITTYPWRPDATDTKSIGLELFLNGEKANLLSHNHNRHVFRFGIPKNTEVIQSLSLICNTFVPVDHQINADRRELGIPIKLISLK